MLISYIVQLPIYIILKSNFSLLNTFMVNMSHVLFSVLKTTLFSRTTHCFTSKLYSKDQKLSEPLQKQFQYKHVLLLFGA